MSSWAHGRGSTVYNKSVEALRRQLVDMIVLQNSNVQYNATQIEKEHISLDREKKVMSKVAQTIGELRW